MKGETVMSSIRRKALNVVAIVVAFTMLITTTGAMNNPLTPQEIMGTLRISGDQTVNVNGSQVGNGGTITSGSQITTPANSGATIDLGNLGSVQVDPGTTFQITYSANSINVTVTSGNVVVSTQAGVVGNITLANGQTLTTGSAGGTSISTTGAQTAGAIGGAGGGAGGAAATIAGVSIFGGLVVIINGVANQGWGRGRNPSPTEPRGPR
jgi:hypothetical protein